MITLNNSLEFAQIESKILSSIVQIRDFRHRTDLTILLNNVRMRVRELSKLEVEARRHHKQSITTDMAASINEDLAQLEQLITFATLLS